MKYTYLVYTVFTLRYFIRVFHSPRHARHLSFADEKAGVSLTMIHHVSKIDYEAGTESDKMDHRNPDPSNSDAPKSLETVNQVWCMIRVSIRICDNMAFST